MTAPTRRGRPDTAPPPWMALLGAILTGVPRLPGQAACWRHVETFDRAADGDREAVQEAIEICGRCPVRDRCAEWIARAHPQRPPPGVWAGRYQPQPTTRRKKATT